MNTGKTCDSEQHTDKQAACDDMRAKGRAHTTNGPRDLIDEFRTALLADVNATARCEQAESARKQTRGELARVLADCADAGVESDKLARESIRLQKKRPAQLAERRREASRLRKIRSRVTRRHGQNQAPRSQVRS